VVPEAMLLYGKPPSRAEASVQYMNISRHLLSSPFGRVLPVSYLSYHQTYNL